MARKPRENHPLTGVTIGTAECANGRRECGATVALKVAKTGTVFANCNGEYEDKACGCRTWYGVKDSREMIEEYEHGKENEDRADGTGEAAGGGEVGSVGPAERGDAGAGDDQRGRKRKLLFG